ncbi:MAG: LSM domain-containing protein [Nanoarchaeota archaeon]|nr:LSM domain-containing protein [Nanoarchaeota archaeon]
MEKYPTPIETLHEFKGREIIVELRNKETICGELVAFDLSTNLTLKTAEGTRFFQGSSVNILYSKNETESTGTEVKEESPSEPETPKEAEVTEELPKKEEDKTE